MTKGLPSRLKVKELTYSPAAQWDGFTEKKNRCDRWQKVKMEPLGPMVFMHTCTDGRTNTDGRTDGKLGNI